MNLQYSPRNNPRVIIIQKLYGKFYNEDDAVKVAEKIGYPVLVRPSYVLGGRSMMIVYKEKYLRKYMQETIEVSEDRPVLIDQYLDGAVEVDVDCLSDGEKSVIGGIMEHIELAGIHSGDSACMIPSMTLSDDVLKTIRSHTYALSNALNVCGLMNIQYAIKDKTVYVLEVNPRASRTVPFVSKSIGVPIAKIASLVMAGKKLDEIGYTEEYIPKHVSTKEAVFPFNKFQGVDVVLSPEMKSTGEVMGIDFSSGISYLKTLLACQNNPPSLSKEKILFSICPGDIKNDREVISLVEDLINLGFKIYTTLDTTTYLYDRGIKTIPVFSLGEGHPDTIDLIKENNLHWIVNIPSTGPSHKVHEIVLRSEAVADGIPLMTTFTGLAAAIEGFKALKNIERLDVCSIQEYHRHAPKLSI